MRIRPGDRTESASDLGKDDAANNSICSTRRDDSWTERFCLCRPSLSREELNHYLVVVRHPDAAKGVIVKFRPS
jgi:hypothetical protein